MTEAFAKLISDWGWIVVLGLVFGTGEVLTRIFDGRRKLAHVRGERDGLRVVNQDLTQRVARYEALENQHLLQARDQTGGQR